MASREKGYRLEKLKLEVLEFDTRNPRFKGFVDRVNNQTSVEQLVKNVPGISSLEESIAKIGVVEPLYAVKNNGKYRVVEGNQRLFVLRRLRQKNVRPPPGISWDSISTFVIPEDTPELEIMRIQAVLQQTKKDWPPESEAAHYYEMVEDEIGDTEDERLKRVAETVKVQPGYIRKRIRAWKEWRAYVKEMDLKPEDVGDKFSYFFEMKKKTRGWFEEPENRTAYYHLITTTDAAPAKIRTVKKEDNLDDFEEVVDKPHILKKLLNESDYFLSEAVTAAEMEDPKLALTGLKLARTLADSLTRASVEQIKKIKQDHEIYPHIRRLHDVIERKFMDKR